MKTTMHINPIQKNILKTVALSFMLLIGAVAQAQTPDAPEAAETPELADAPELDDDAYVSGDTTNISIGCRSFSLVRYNEDSLCLDKKDKKRDDHKLNYWSGFDMGVNGFVNPSQSLSMGDDYAGFELDYGKSLSVSLNIAEKKAKLIGDAVGIYTGLGFEWNTYAFRNNSTLWSNTDTTAMFIDSTVAYSKNKLHATYLTVPLMLEFNTSTDYSSNFHIAVGLLGGWKIGSNYKVHYESEAERIRNKAKGNYNLNPIKYSAHARVGYGKFTLFASYGLSTLFEKDRGPEIYPVNVGITLIGF
jgi:hypothetical protein